MARIIVDVPDGEYCITESNDKCMVLWMWSGRSGQQTHYECKKFKRGLEAVKYNTIPKKCPDCLEACKEVE